MEILAVIGRIYHSQERLWTYSEGKTTLRLNVNASKPMCAVCLEYWMIIVPVFRMTAQEWCQNDNFIFTSGNFSYWKDFMLRFRMAYVHHSAWSGPVLFQTTRCTIAHSHRIVRCHLTFNIFSRDLKKKCRQIFLLEIWGGFEDGGSIYLFWKKTTFYL